MQNPTAASRGRRRRARCSASCCRRPVAGPGRRHPAPGCRRARCRRRSTTPLSGDPSEALWPPMTYESTVVAAPAPGERDDRHAVDPGGVDQRPRRRPAGRRRSEVRLTGTSSALRTTPATMSRGPLAVSSAASTRAPSRDTSNDTIRPSVGRPGTGNGCAVGRDRRQGAGRRRPGRSRCTRSDRATEAADPARESSSSGLGAARRSG